MSQKKTIQALSVDRYDGQSIYVYNEQYYELGGYLGGGTAGVVYEAKCLKSKKQHVAIKILNPIGFKLMPITLLQRCLVVIKGKSIEVEVEMGKQPMREEHVWWLAHPSSKQIIAAYEDPTMRTLRELPLPKCIDIWGHDIDESNEIHTEVNVQGLNLKIPKIPRKYRKFARNRRLIYREISHMSSLGNHENVLRLDEALELLQDSKCTIFLVLELASGGELFDRIKVDCGNTEECSHHYFKQLLSGVAFCHSQGVCHRDLKPENLLLADNDENATLKIADFGLSALCSITDDAPNNRIRRLRSVVGSPHYVAPEVLGNTGNGYDGTKVDTWSLGVILYAMLAGSLPFGKELLHCLRFDKFRTWIKSTAELESNPASEVSFPTWFFPRHLSDEVKVLLTQLLDPDPTTRISVKEAQHSPWVVFGPQCRRSNDSSSRNKTPTSRMTESLVLVASSICRKSPSSKPFTRPRQTQPFSHVASPQIRLDMSEIYIHRREIPVTPELDNNDLSIHMCGILHSPPLASIFQKEKNSNNNKSPLLQDKKIENHPSIKSNHVSSIVTMFQVDHEVYAQDFEKPLFQRGTYSMEESLFSRKGMAMECGGEPLRRRMSFKREHTKSLGANEMYDLDLHTLDHRSARFTTSVPGSVILKAIEMLILKDPSPYPYPYRRIAQHVRIIWKTYLLEVAFGGIVMCTVQSYLVNAGLYLIEFKRGQFDIFQFQRFCEYVRDKLSAYIKKDSSLLALNLHRLIPMLHCSRIV